MFGLTRREQRWKADQQAAELLVSLATTAVRASAEVRVAEAKTDASEMELLRAENLELRRLLARYRHETPLEHQPHMIAHAADAALGSNAQAKRGGAVAASALGAELGGDSKEKP
jgi:nitrate reductase cytochrome c-type subunit